VVLDEPVSPQDATSLLVSGEHQGDRTVRNGSSTLTGTNDREQHRVEILHVDGAAAEQIAVDDLCGEWVDLPVSALRGNDIQVSVDEQSGLGRVLVAPSGDHARAPRCGLEKL